jgi:hypothetical protein
MLGAIVTREWLYWFDQQGDRCLSPDEKAHKAEQDLETLRAKLHQRGINPDAL